MTEQIKNTERDCENCVFHENLALSGCRLWECKGTVTIEDAEKAIRSLQAWEEVLHELEGISVFADKCDDTEEASAYRRAADIIKQKLAEIEG